MITLSDIAAKPPAIELALMGLVAFAQLVETESEKLVEWLAAECKAPSTADALRYQTSLYTSKLESQLGMIFSRLRDPDEVTAPPKKVIKKFSPRVLIATYDPPAGAVKPGSPDRLAVKLLEEPTAWKA